ncbi:MAG: family 16 glycosylhydrolase [Marinilabiliaceae bacterium]|nr:family 16 glycosylhydrolase [Marinilabiliaceae bacterium]
MKFILFFIFLTATCGGGKEVPDEPVPNYEIQCILNPAELNVSAKGNSYQITITANRNWIVSSNQDWCVCKPLSGSAGSKYVEITVTSNIDVERVATLTFIVDNLVKTVKVMQDAGEEPNYIPPGYSLIWQDEFNEPRLSNGKPTLPKNSHWWFETGHGKDGWGNNEIQYYVSGFSGVDTCAQIYGGTLKIIAQKVGNQVFSIRMNSDESWKYGYFEARIKVPTGKGTWPAFWMLPKNFVTWPDDGEIDIMEAVGFAPNNVHCSIHCKAYNHINNTEKTASKAVPTAQTDFHIYAVEWTEDYIYGFVDGVRYFTFLNDKKGNKDTWPFNEPFYLKLNLAWGGNWGGAQGIDETALPATYEIDYVRVYQKEK